MRKHKNDVSKHRIPTARRFGERLRSMRLARQWTQTEVASQLGLPKMTVCKLEAGKTCPRLDIAFQLADLFSIPLDDMR